VSIAGRIRISGQELIKIHLARSRFTSSSSASLWPILWSCLIVAVSVVPFKFRHDNGLQSQFHRASHVIAFLATMMAFCGCARTIKSMLVYAGWAVCLAVSSEWIETAVYHNRFESADVLLDLGGIAIGLMLVAAARSLRRYCKLR
jgi:hypothetical protein